jgi:hypothetical protein
MTILIHFHQSHCRTFKAYYTEHVQVYLTSEFPHLVSYQRFVALIPGVLVPMLAYLQSRYGTCTGTSQGFPILDKEVKKKSFPRRLQKTPRATRKPLHGLYTMEPAGCCGSRGRTGDDFALRSITKAARSQASAREALCIGVDLVLTDLGETGRTNQFEWSQRLDAPSLRRTMRALWAASQKPPVPDDLLQCALQSGCQAA